MKLYLVQSSYTSDPYEPSETLTWGAYSSRELALQEFRDWVSSLVTEKVILSIKIFEKKKEDNKQWKDWSEKYNHVKAEALDYVIDGIKESVKEESVELIWEKVKNVSVYNKYRQYFFDIDEKEKQNTGAEFRSDTWDIFYDFSRIFDFGDCYSFEVVEMVVDKPVKHPHEA